MYKAIAKQIQTTRKKLGLSQQALANQAGVTQTMISKAEAGKDLRLSTLYKILASLELTVVATSTTTAMAINQANRLQQYQSSTRSLFEQFEVKDDD